MAAEPRRDLPVPVPVELRRPDGTTAVEYAVNVSPRGLCLQLKDPLTEGDRLGVEFTLPPCGPTVRAEGRVVWTSWEKGASGEGGGFHEAGVQLSGVEEEVEQQLSAYASHPTDRRR
jgi:hypothetical protein